MHCLASIKLDSSTDKQWKKEGYKKRTFYKNDFKLRKDIYVCKDVINLLPLLKNADIEVLMSGLPLQLKGIDKDAG